MTQKTVALNLKSQTIEFPTIEGSDHKQGIDVAGFKRKSGMYFFDPSLNNIAVAASSITLIDNQNDKLFYRGYDIEELVRKSNFVEVAYLLANGVLPSKENFKAYSNALSNHSLIHESMRNFFDSFPGDAHPLAILATMVTALSSYYPQPYEENKAIGVDVTIRLLAKVRTLAAWSYKKSIGHPVIYPRDELPYWTNFLNMMFAVPLEPIKIPEMDDKIMNQLMILYSDHEQNIATTTVRLLASTRANLFVCINAGISAYWGAREAAYDVLTVPMIEHMLDNSLSPEKYFEKFINGIEPLKSPAFGHAKYKTLDPRGKISKQLFYEYMKEIKFDEKMSPFIEKALEVEQFTSSHTFFKELGMYPNLDFYSALIFHMMGIPPNMYNVIRVIGKLPGWIAHWQEQRKNDKSGSMRPQQIYTGKTNQKYVNLADRM